MRVRVFPPRDETPAERKAFLEHYAAVLTHEAEAREFANDVNDWRWLRDAAARALREAAAIDPEQGDLFGMEISVTVLWRRA